MIRSATLQSAFVTGVILLAGLSASAQVDPIRRNLIQIGYDQALVGQGPQAVYAYYYYNNPELFNTNTALRMAVAPLYVDSEIGFKKLFSPTTDFGLGIYGGALADNYYDVSQGHYYKDQSFYGNSGGASLSIYQLLDPGMLIPVNLVARAGARYIAYEKSRKTADDFVLPDNQPITFVRTGIRIAGKEPRLEPDIGMELSFWYEHLWRPEAGTYGYAQENELSSSTGLYWVYAGLNYRWTNINHQISFAVTAGGSEGTDPLNAWRLGGVLPLVSEFPLMLPGYYYQELTAKSFVHFFAAYMLPLDRAQCWQLRFEAGAARVNYVPGFEQPQDWQSGAGVGVTFTPQNKACKIILRYGYGFQALRNGEPGAQSIGLLFQYDFEHRARQQSDQR